MKKKIVVLVSGGMDSTILTHHTKLNHPDDEIVLLHYDYGHPFEHKERECLPQGTLIRKFEWLNPNEPYPIPEEDPGHLPGRDFAMIAQAMVQENPDKIYLALLHGEMDSYLDQSYEFYYRLNHLLSVISPTGKRVEVEAPLEARGLTKLGAVKWGLENGLTPEYLAATSSCMHHEDHKCGMCPVCTKRWAIFVLLGQLEYEGDTVFQNVRTMSRAYKRFLELMFVDGNNDYLDALKVYFGTDDCHEIERLFSERIERAKRNVCE